MTNLTFDPAVLFQIGFYLAVLIFTVHAVVLTYHWFSFGADKKHSKTALTIHLIVGGSLIAIMALTLTSI